MIRRSVLPPSAFKRRKPERAGRPEWKRDEAFKRWLRALPCACGGANAFCHGPTEVAHVDYAAKGTPDAKGLSTKVADRFSLPLSRGCHAAQTSVFGWPDFEKSLPGGDAEALTRVYFDRFEQDQRKAGKL